jgi:membrane protease YdiL (CAAX protease family)
MAFRTSAAESRAAAKDFASCGWQTGDASVATSVLLVLIVWTIVLGVAPLLQGRLGADSALLFALGLATGVVVLVRRRRAWPIRLGWIHGALGFGAGFVGLPAWVAMIVITGRAIGLEPARDIAPGLGGPSYWLATIVVAPVLEELLYRERLLSALLSRFGSVAAVALSSVLFALPHLQAWELVGAAIVGFGLGTLFLLTGSIALCVGLHSGLNAAVVSCGLPPLRWAFSPQVSALIGCVSFVIAALLGRIGARLDAAQR